MNRRKFLASAITLALAPKTVPSSPIAFYENGKGLYIGEGQFGAMAMNAYVSRFWYMPRLLSGDELEALMK